MGSRGFDEGWAEGGGVGVVDMKGGVRNLSGILNGTLKGTERQSERQKTGRQKLPPYGLPQLWIAQSTVQLQGAGGGDRGSQDKVLHWGPMGAKLLL